MLRSRSAFELPVRVVFATEAAHGAIIAAVPVPLSVLTAVSAPVAISVLESTDYWFCPTAINVSSGQHSPIL